VDQTSVGSPRGHPDPLHILIEANLGFVVGVAREYRSMGLPFEDLLNEGHLGLIEAAGRFDPGKGTKFITYAMWWIRKSILRAITEQTRIVRLPAGQQKKLRDVREAERTLRLRLGGEPTREEIACYLAMTTSAVEKVLRYAMDRADLHRPDGDDRGPSLAERLRENRIGPEEKLIRREKLEEALRIFGSLAFQERRILALRLGLWGEPPCTLAEIGNRLGLSRERIRQIELRATAHLRERIGQTGNRRRRPLAPRG